MAVVIVITRPDKPEVKKVIPVERKMVLGNSIYCDVVLEDKTVAGMQCQIQLEKTGNIVATNLDLKREVLINQARLKKSSIKAADVLKIGPFLLQIDQTKLTPEELAVLNTDYEETV